MSGMNKDIFGHVKYDKLEISVKEIFPREKELFI